MLNGLKSGDGLTGDVLNSIHCTVCPCMEYICVHTVCVCVCVCVCMRVCVCGIVYHIIADVASSWPLFYSMLFAVSPYMAWWAVVC